MVMQLLMRAAGIVHTEILQAQFKGSLSKQYDNNTLSPIALDQMILRGSNTKSQTEDSKDS